ncbi:MAG TPA: protein kinase [Kofleriaceae bacterium]
MPSQDLSGEILEDRYQIMERISEGAMGVVYRGTRLKLDRPVAIKVMHATLPIAMEGRKRFEREAQVMARLEHPHCVSIIDVGVHRQKPYVVMELVRGRSLFELLDEQGRFEIPRAVDVLRQVLSGLSHAHEQGIIHRDIKPANIMVTPKAPLGLHVRILDFGLARMLGAANASVSNGVAVGTPSYMAPEQCRGEELDARVDVYACGVVLFEMLTGKKPFIAKDPIAIVKKQIDETPPRLADVAPGNYGALEDVVARALAKSPLDRYPSAVAMAEALDAAVTGRSASAPEPTTQFLTSDVIEPAESSANVPITVGSSVMIKPQKPGSSVRRQLPLSRTRWLVMSALLFAGAAVAAAIVWRDRIFGTGDERADAAVTVVVDKQAPADAAPPPDPAAELAATASQLAASGKVQAAIESLVKARKVYPDSAELAYVLGKLYFGKMWWHDGLANFKDAVKLDPKLKQDPELIKLVIRGFITTPGHDYRLANFLVEIGAPAKPLLEETAKTHPNAGKRQRAQTLLNRMR